MKILLSLLCWLIAIASCNVLFNNLGCLLSKAQKLLRTKLDVSNTLLYTQENYEPIKSLTEMDCVCQPRKDATKKSIEIPNLTTDKVCGFNYVVSSNPVTFRDASAICCAMNTTLLQIQSQSEFDCISKWLNATTKGTFWTGSVWRTGDIPRWCQTREIVSQIGFWQKNEPRSFRSAHETCAALRVTPSEVALQSNLCASKIGFICKGAPLRSEKINLNCNCNNTLGEVKPNAVAPKVSTIKMGCTKDYYALITDTLLSFSEASDACCSLGMKLVSIEDTMQLQCILKLLQVDSTRPDIWTSGTDFPCYGFHSWCTNYRTVPSSIWQQGDPNNLGGAEHCVAITSQNSTGLRDQQCSQKLGAICQSSLQPAQFKNFQ